MIYLNEDRKNTTQKDEKFMDWSGRVAHNHDVRLSEGSFDKSVSSGFLVLKQ
jgi:hypothetical protein